MLHSKPRPPVKAFAEIWQSSGKTPWDALDLSRRRSSIRFFRS